MQISSPYLCQHILPYIIGPSFLDVGCGAGLYGFLVKHSWYRTDYGKKFGKIDAVEFSEEQVNELLKCNIYDNIYRNNAKNLPLEDNSYDTVISIENLEHLYANEVYDAFHELVRVCKKRLIISTPPLLEWSLALHGAPMKFKELIN